jgi:flap endonuclease-1
MGIKGLTQLIKKNSPNSIEHIGLYTMKDKRIAIDTSIFLYKSLMNVRSKGDYLRNDDGKVVSHIQGLYYKTNQLLSFGITPIYIFDGKPPQEKSECIKARVKKANDCKMKMETTTDEVEKKNLEKGTIRIKKEYIDDLKHLFSLMGVSYIHPDGEAEAYASELCRLGFVDAVMTEDMDTLSYGCPYLYRNCIDKSIKRPEVISVFNFHKILEDLKLNHDEFIDMCILCGCDYCPTIPKVGPVRALKFIQKYKTIENLISSDEKIDIPEEFKSKYVASRGLFKVFDSKIDLNDLPISETEYNSEDIYKYLVNDCNMSMKRIQNSLQKVYKISD